MTSSDVVRMADSNYVCPQCGPDPAGEEEHARTHHTFEDLFGCSPVTGEPVGRGIEDRPYYEHDCTRCTFLGHKNGMDLYHCVQGGVHQMPTVIARRSSEGSDYKSGMEFAGTDPELAEAKTRAFAKGLRV